MQELVERPQPEECRGPGGWGDASGGLCQQIGLDVDGLHAGQHEIGIMVGQVGAEHAEVDRVGDLGGGRAFLVQAQVSPVGPHESVVVEGGQLTAMDVDNGPCFGLVVAWVAHDPAPSTARAEHVAQLTKPVQGGRRSRIGGRCRSRLARATLGCLTYRREDELLVTGGFTELSMLSIGRLLSRRASAK